MGIEVRSTNSYPELAAPGNGATRRRSISISVAPGSKPCSASAAVPVGPDWAVPLLLTGILDPFITGCLWSNCSVVVPAPDLLIRSRLRLNTGFGPTSSAVGINDPVTITRSTSAAGAAPPAPRAQGAPPPRGGGGGAAPEKICLWQKGRKTRPPPQVRCTRIRTYLA